jgi:hypothetical protein
MRAASIPGVQHYVFDHEAPAAWTGPVERRDPDVVRQRSVHLTWRCPARHCREFTMNGAYKVGRCNFCHEPRPQ